MRPSLAIGKCQLTYDDRVVQERYIIDHDDFLSIHEPIKKIILFSGHGIVSENLKPKLDAWFGNNFVTNKSPVYLAGINNTPMFVNNNNSINVKLEIIESYD
jgi:hypothetical protein